VTQDDQLASLRNAARRIAVDCRRVVQGCLREEEWQDADVEFAAIILTGLIEAITAGGDCDRRQPL
jgi:hypothetical protein